MTKKERGVIGSAENFWLYDPKEDSYDLTHPTSPDADSILPRIPLQTTTNKVWVDPAKTALVIIDMQNFFLSPALGRSTDGPGAKAVNKLLEHAIPACRKAGIRLVWLNWGLTQEDIDSMPPSTLRAFGYKGATQGSKPNPQATDHTPTTKSEREMQAAPKDQFARPTRIYKGLGSDVGPIKLDDGTIVDGGRLLMRDQWNSELVPSLEKARQEGINGKIEKEDVWIHKNRMSGLWGPETDCTNYLESAGITTLLFAGVNTDQCVLGSFQDAMMKGWDCLMLKDGCGTTSPSFAQDCVEYNAARSWGFVLSCKDLADGVENIKRA